jgi:RNA-directed DNA polymerase
VLLHARRCYRVNGVGVGVDGQSFERIEAWGLERVAGEWAKEIREKTYSPLGRIQ